MRFGLIGRGQFEVFVFNVSLMYFRHNPSIRGKEGGRKEKIRPAKAGPDPYSTTTTSRIWRVYLWQGNFPYRGKA